MAHLILSMEGVFPQIAHRPLGKLLMAVLCPGSLAEKPELSGTVIILVAIPETMVILGFVVAVIILLGG